MILPRVHREGKHLRQGFTLMILAGLLLLGATQASSETAAAPECADPPGHCLFLPLLTRMPDPRVRSDALAMYGSMYLASETTATGWNGDVDVCSPGNISETYRAAVLKRINYFRLMAGVPMLQGFRTEYNQQAQDAALLMSANNKVDHSVDATWTNCSELEGEGVWYSNAIDSFNGPQAINTYMGHEGDTLVYLRRYLLFPQTLEMGNGDVPATSGYMAVNVLRVMDGHYYAARPATRSEFVSWPPAAYVPYPVVYPLWSFSLDQADFSQATVSMSVNGFSINIMQYPPVDGYGENTLVWWAGTWGPWPNPVVDTTYTVTISNVLVNGQMRSFTYDVVIFDPGS